MRVLAAMSGGVDSAVAAARAADAGHEVTGVHLALARAPKSHREGARGCCSLEDARDARRAADVLGIPFYVWDLAAAFEAAVIDDFVAEYAAGRTPNPCLRCNETIKFAAVAERAVMLGFDALCTGHYARLKPGPHGSPALHRAIDPAKDQSYVLGVLTADQLGVAMFPLGDSLKSDVRAEAASRGLLVADKPDSHDICFIPDGDTASFLRKRLGSLPGEVVDTDGTVLGSHDGTYGFTVGQRRGLDLSRSTPDGSKRYVLAIEPVQRRVVVGAAQQLQVSDIPTSSPTWCGPAPELPWHGSVQLRAHGLPAGVSVAADGHGGLALTLDKPVGAVAAGQSAVLYADDGRVVGQATVESVLLPAVSSS